MALSAANPEHVIMSPQITVADPSEPAQFLKSGEAPFDGAGGVECSFKLC